MIAEFDKVFLENCKKEWLAELVATILAHGHYIKLRPDTKPILNAAVDKHASTVCKTRYYQCKSMDINLQMCNYMTTIKVDGSRANHEYEILFGEKSALLLENGMYEWETLKRLFEVYKKDPLCKHVVAWIQEAIRSGRIINENAGGTGGFARFLDERDAPGQYEGLYKYKVMALFDSDSTTEGEVKHDDLYRKLSGKDIKDKLNPMNEVYTLQQPVYIWHQWYKREFENYFPNSSYEALGFNTSILSENNVKRNYEDFGLLKKTKSGALWENQKRLLPKLVNKLSRKEFEKGLQHFNCYGQDVSEFQMVLLKIAKLI